MNIDKVNFFPIRHLSPSSSYNLLKYLDEINPKIVLVEGPRDLTDVAKMIADKDVKPPIAMLCYTEDIPVRSILYPMAVYSPEYQAIKWSFSNDKEFRFIDMESSITLGVDEKVNDSRDKCESTSEKESVNESNIENKNVNNIVNIYEDIARGYDEESYESFWERNFEQNIDLNTFRESMILFGNNIRYLDEVSDKRNIVREKIMRFEIEKAVRDGYKENEIVVIIGAYHTEGIKKEKAIKSSELSKLKKRKSSYTLMPYSYKRLSTRSGYGAGNEAPKYFEYMWEYMKEGNLNGLSSYYTSFIAGELRADGKYASSANVIDSLTLAKGLTYLKGGKYPVLADLRDSVKTCMSEGQFIGVASHIAMIEIGTDMGSVKSEFINVALSKDFDRELKKLKLEKYKNLVEKDLSLDLRENRRVKTKQAAFRDLNRSIFFNRLELLSINFIKRRWSNEPYRENWTLSWSEENDIELVESSLLGDTLEIAGAYRLYEKLEEAIKISDVSKLLGIAYNCNLLSMVEEAVKKLQNLSVAEEDFSEIVKVLTGISEQMKFTDIRKTDTKILEVILVELFYRATLNLSSVSECNDTSLKRVRGLIDDLDIVATENKELIDYETYIEELRKISNDDSKNPNFSGHSCAILLEKSLMDNRMLDMEISRRIKRGISVDIAAGWFEGLASRNRLSIASNKFIFERLDSYLEELSNEDFKRALVYLHRSFSDFSNDEKYRVCESLSSIWNISTNSIDEFINIKLTQSDMDILKYIEENFDYGEF